MKKIIAIVLIVLLIVTMFTACGDDGSSSCGHASCAEEGPFYCMGKNNTCNNKTYCCYDLYCSECD